MISQFKVKQFYISLISSLFFVSIGSHATGVAISLINNTFEKINISKTEIQLALNANAAPQSPLYNCLCTNPVFPGAPTCNSDNQIIWQPLQNSVMTTDTTRLGAGKQSPFYFILPGTTCQDAVVTANLSAFTPPTGSSRITQLQPIATINMGFTSANPTKWNVTAIPTNLANPNYMATVTPTKCPSNQYIPVSECFIITVTKVKH